jgi:ribosomal protein RSM22 (predicted rRNA methylase)
MNELSRLLSGRQIRLHASRLSRRPGAARGQQRSRKKQQPQQGGEEEEEEEEDEASDEEEEEEEEDDDEEDDALLEGEGPQGQYYRNSALAKPSWAGRAASPPEALAYLATRAVPNFSIALRVLREAAAAATGPLAAVLDVGCGPGSGLLAARTLWGQQQPPRSVEVEDGEEGDGERGVERPQPQPQPQQPQKHQSALRRLDGVDHSGAMRDLAKHLLAPSDAETRAGGPSSPPPTLTLHRHLPPLVQQARRTGAPRYDVVLASWTLSELPSDASRALAVGMMWELVSDAGGMLVLVEDGSPEGSRLVRSARKLLLDQNHQQDQRDQRPGRRHQEEEGEATSDIGSGSGTDSGTRARTVAPCPHDRPCPLLRDDWCRFTQRVPLGRLPRGGGGPASSGPTRTSGGGGGYKDVAFSYVIVQKTPAAALVGRRGDDDAAADARLAALRRLRVDPALGPEQAVHAPTEADWEAATEAAPTRDGWARLIRNPKKAKGHVHLDLCLPEGRLERRVVAKSASKRVPGTYLAARKAQWGGLWPAEKGV